MAKQFTYLHGVQLNRRTMKRVKRSEVCCLRRLHQQKNTRSPHSSYENILTKPNLLSQTKKKVTSRYEQKFVPPNKFFTTQLSIQKKIPLFAHVNRKISCLTTQNTVLLTVVVTTKCRYILSIKRSVGGVQKNWIRHNTPHPIPFSHVTYYHTNLRSKQKLLTVVTTRCSYLAHKTILMYGQKKRDYRAYNAR